MTSCYFFHLLQPHLTKTLQLLKNTLSNDLISEHATTVICDLGLSVFHRISATIRTDFRPQLGLFSSQGCKRLSCIFSSLTSNTKHDHQRHDMIYDQRGDIVMQSYTLSLMLLSSSCVRYAVVLRVCAPMIHICKWDDM